MLRNSLRTTLSVAVTAAILGVFGAAASAAAEPTASPLPASQTTVHIGVTPFGCSRAASGHTIGCLGYFGPRTASRSASVAHGARPDTTGSSTTVGLTPAKLISAYNLTGTSGAGRTVAIVDAQDDPKAESDLATYRAAYGLPPCTTANGCFKKVNQNGATSPLPATDYGWAEEISLDLDMVSAICPTCHILLVEANTPDTTPLATAVNTAATTPGVVAVSNSYGGAEDATTLPADASFNHVGIAITASSGDSGYGVEWPASSRYVTAVGGTSLTTATNARGWTETAWGSAGSGCSAQEVKPAWQHDTGCAFRTVADVSAVADPEHRRRRLRLLQQLRDQQLLRLPARARAGLRSRRLGAGRRHERVVTDHRERVRAGRQHRLDRLRLVPVQPHRLAERRDQRLERKLRRHLPLHGGLGLRRPDRPRHPERHRRVLTSPPQARASHEPALAPALYGSDATPFGRNRRPVTRSETPVRSRYGVIPPR